MNAGKEAGMECGMENDTHRQDILKTIGMKCGIETKTGNSKFLSNILGAQRVSWCIRKIISK